MPTRAPDPADFLDVDSALSDDERAIRDAVRDFAQDRLAPHVGH